MGRVYVPSFYPDFCCIADKCRHSCCIGWEIDIDKDSLERYKRAPGPLGMKLARMISRSSQEAPHFLLQGKEERCPFLTDTNLCELILGLGEDYLCQICRDHPRFRNFYSDREEIGLGLCCEEAARLLLSFEDPIRIVPLETENTSDEEPLEPEEEDFFSLRDKLFHLLEDRTADLSEKIDAIENEVDLPMLSLDYPSLGRLLMDLERLDPSWENALDLLNTSLSKEAIESFRSCLKDANREKEYENLLWYFLYRHLPDGIFDESLPSRVRLATISTRILLYMGAVSYTKNGSFTLSEQVELVRMFSSEIEYSEENISSLLAAFA
ncbi:MAG: flagellin lysine-N-methylase [Clostridiales bacterium]|nr:flagellin lysine-N-methylase [Clostridiales bacterium]